MIIGALIMGFFVSIGTALVALTWQLTAERIAENQRQALLRGLNQLIEPSIYNNALEEDLIHVSDPLLGNGPQAVYRARQDGVPVALALRATAPDGYAGNIELLIGIRYDGQLSGVRVLQHRETPGLAMPSTSDAMTGSSALPAAHWTTQPRPAGRSKRMAVTSINSLVPPSLHVR
jgi:electron transport complex protein RnfG